VHVSARKKVVSETSVYRLLKAHDLLTGRPDGEYRWMLHQKVAVRDEIFYRSLDGDQSSCS
jgi:hypothetical protein